MKNTSVFLGLLLLISAVVGMSSCSRYILAHATRIAYVDIDSLEAHYELLEIKKLEFKNRQEQMDGELQASYQKMEEDAAEVQKKAAANALSQEEYEAAQKRLTEMQQSLEARKQTLTAQLTNDQDDFNNAMRARLDSFLTEYNKNKNYDYILTFSFTSSSMLHANKKWDITADVIKGMNAMSGGGNTNQKNK